MPSVAMNRMMPSWFTSLRNTTRSITNATAIMTSRRRERGPERQISVSRTSVSAANSTIAPWAKLNTPDALKISTKPSATSE